LNKARLRNLKKLRKTVIMGNSGIQKQPELSKFYFGEAKGDSEEDLEDLDEEQIQQIFKDQGLMKKEKNDTQKKEPFKGVKCNHSFFYFSKQNRLRVLCYNLSTHK